MGISWIAVVVMVGGLVGAGRILKVTTVRVIGGNGFFYHYEMPQFDSYYWINEMHQVKGIDSAE